MSSGGHEGRLSASLSTYEKLGREIARIYGELSPALKAVAHCISQNPNDVGILNLSRLSEKYRIPASNFVRFSKRMGYSGFNELQSIYRSRIVDIIPSVEDRLLRFEQETQSSRIGNSALAALIREDFRLLNDLDLLAIEQICKKFSEVILSSRKIFVMGAMRFHPVTFFYNYAFTYLGLDVTILDNQGFLAREYAQNFAPDTCLLVSTFNYYHREVVALADLAAQKKVRILTVTDFDFSPLAKIAEHCIYLPGMGDNFRISLGPIFVIAQHIVNEVAYAKGHPALGSKTVGTDSRL
ncbi:MurR/RpiR family transcriptional regulator [soil metagenome]